MALMSCACALRLFAHFCYVTVRALPPPEPKPCSTSVRRKISTAIHHLATITRKGCTPIRGRTQIVRIMQERARVAVFAQTARKVSAWPGLVFGMCHLATLLAEAAWSPIRATALDSALQRQHGGKRLGRRGMSGHRLWRVALAVRGYARQTQSL
jgi:hypothetical protein